MFLLETNLDLICTLIWPRFYGYRHCGTREGGLNMLKYLSPVCAKLNLYHYRDLWGSFMAVSLVFPSKFQSSVHVNLAPTWSGSLHGGTGAAPKKCGGSWREAKKKERKRHVEAA